MVGSFHEIGCSATYVMPGFVCDGTNCCSTRNACGSISVLSKSVNHRLKNRESAIVIGWRNIQTGCDSMRRRPETMQLVLSPLPRPTFPIATRWLRTTGRYEHH